MDRKEQIRKIQEEKIMAEEWKKTYLPELKKLFSYWMIPMGLSFQLLLSLMYIKAQNFYIMLYFLGVTTVVWFFIVLPLFSTSYRKNTFPKNFEFLMPSFPDEDIIEMEYVELTPRIPFYDRPFYKNTHNYLLGTKIIIGSFLL